MTNLDKPNSASAANGTATADTPGQATSRGKAHLLIRLTLVFLLFLVLIHQIGSKLRPAGPSDGTELFGTATPIPAERDTLRIGAFNIHYGKGGNDVRDISQTAAVLAPLQLDIVGLNEVRGPRRSEPVGQAECLGKTLSLQWILAPTVRTWINNETGNGLLSRVPVDSWQRIPLTTRLDRSYRNVLFVRMTWKGRPVNVLVTHLNRRYDEERRAQLRTVTQLFLAMESPAMLIGDLNTKADAPELAPLLTAPGVLDPLAGRELPPDQDVLNKDRIDWILLKGFEATDAGIAPNGASDHPVVWAEVRLKDAGPQRAP